MGIFSRAKAMWHAWNAFIDTRNSPTTSWGEGMSFGIRPDRTRFRHSTERSIIGSIITRLAIDVSSLDVRHVRLDADNRYESDIDSGLNNCLTVEANIDQAARQFRRDVMLTLFDQGVCAVVPVDTTLDPNVSASFDIKTLRVGEITGWMPQHVRMRLYNDQKGIREEITLAKNFVAIIENPLYAVMNETNSTLQRLIRKLNLLDVVDDASSSGKLDIIIQLPYTIKSEARRQAADQRRKDLEAQLTGSKYGVAYADGTEKVIQLNRPAENNLLKQVEYLVNMLYGQLGLTPEVMNGTADEKTMNNYRDRTIEPLVTAMIEAMRRVFLTKTARSQGQTIMFFDNPFKLASMADLAEIADKFTRNEIVTSNEFRSFLGIKPSKDPKADELRNSNMPEPIPPPDPAQQPIRTTAVVQRPQLTSAPSETKTPQKN